MEATRGQFVRVKKELIADYETRGYKHKKSGYKVINIENAGVFVREFGYIILHNDYEIVEGK